VSQLLTFGKSIISLANKTEDEEVDGNKVDIEWPEDVSAKAKIIRLNVQTMIGYLEAVSNSFVTGWLSIISIHDHNHNHVLKLFPPWTCHGPMWLTVEQSILFLLKPWKKHLQLFNILKLIIKTIFNAFVFTQTM
jgi:hypothetical protein